MPFKLPSESSFSLSRMWFCLLTLCLCLPLVELSLPAMATVANSSSCMSSSPYVLESGSRVRMLSVDLCPRMYPGMTVRYDDVHGVSYVSCGPTYHTGRMGSAVLSVSLSATTDSNVAVAKTTFQEVVSSLLYDREHDLLYMLYFYNFIIAMSGAAIRAGFGQQVLDRAHPQPGVTYFGIWTGSFSVCDKLAYDHVADTLYALCHNQLLAMLQASRLSDSTQIYIGPLKQASCSWCVFVYSERHALVYMFMTNLLGTLLSIDTNSSTHNVSRVLWFDRCDIPQDLVYDERRDIIYASCSTAGVLMFNATSQTITKLAGSSATTCHQYGSLAYSVVHDVLYVQCVLDGRSLVKGIELTPTMNLWAALDMQQVPLMPPRDRFDDTIVRDISANVSQFQFDVPALLSLKCTFVDLVYDIVNDELDIACSLLNYTMSSCEEHISYAEPSCRSLFVSVRPCNSLGPTVRADDSSFSPATIVFVSVALGLCISIVAGVAYRRFRHRMNCCVSQSAWSGSDREMGSGRFIRLETLARNHRQIQHAATANVEPAMS